MSIDYIKISIYLAILVILAAVMTAFSGCISAPKPGDYKDRPVVCLEFMRCLYYNQKNPDKSVCAALCKECAAYERMRFCGDDKNRPPDMSFQSCWDKIE